MLLVIAMASRADTAGLAVLLGVSAGVYLPLQTGYCAPLPAAICRPCTRLPRRAQVSPCVLVVVSVWLVPAKSV
jgi:hypothetical protein